MQIIKNILLKGLGRTGNGFRISLTDLIKESGLTKDEVIIALNSITSLRAWDLVTEDTPEQFKVSVQNMDKGTPVKGGSFTTKQAAKAFVHEMKKSFDLINHGGYIVNYNKRLELFTNY